MKAPSAFFACLFCFPLSGFSPAASAAAPEGALFESFRQAKAGILLSAPALNLSLASFAAQASLEESGDSDRSMQALDQAAPFDRRPPGAAPAVWPLARIFLIHPQSGQRIFRGTGFLTAQNLVVTNFHILSESKGYDFLIQTISGETLPFRRIRHLSASHDLAVLEVENSGWPSLTLAATHQKAPGDVYMAGFLESGWMRELKGRALSGPHAEDDLFALEFDGDPGKGSERGAEAFPPAKNPGLKEYLMFSHPEDMAGFSGSPIVNASGQAEAVFSGHTGEIAFGIPAFKIRELLKAPALPAERSKDELIAEEMAKLFAMAAAGAPEACQALGLNFFHGLGMKRDFQLARLWFQKAALQGFSESQYSLGLMLFQEDDLKSDAEALAWFLRAARQGHARAQYQMGLMLADGLGAEADKTAALKWLELAARQGLPRAQALAGEMYNSGLGARENPEKAFSWFLAAAKAENAGGQLHAGVMYLQGRGTEKNLEKSHYWLQKAAESGEPKAQYLLGFMRLRGIYLKKDLELARDWFLKASERGFAEADEALKRLEGQID